MRRSIKHLLTIAAVIVAVIAAVLLLRNTRKGGFFHHKLKIDDTASVVTGVRSLSALVSACYNDEVILTSHKQRSVNAFGAPVGSVEDEICIIATGQARAGVDLSEIGPDDMYVNGDTLMIKLPVAKIFDVIVNPSDFEIFAEEGKWSHADVVAVESQASARIRRDALSAGILEKASSSAQTQIRSLLRSFGFNEIIFVPYSVPLPQNAR